MGRRLPPAQLPHPGSRVTDMPELHTRLLADVIAVGSPYPLVLTGGYAVRAHRLVNRPSQDLDVATEKSRAHDRDRGYAARRPGSPRLESALAGDRSAVRPIHRDRAGHRTGMRGRHPQGEPLAAGHTQPLRASPRGRGRDRDQGPRPRRPRSPA
ncbi:nucleotidyl transferase AbiEii/AbiGii toxin family protein [Streptomyces cellulosae]